MATAKAKVDEIEVLSKMSTTTLGCKPKECIKADKQLYIGRVFGEVGGMKPKEFNGRTSMMFLGVFQARTADGKFYQSEKLYLPGGVSESLEAAFTANDSAATKFGYDLFVSPSEKSPVGYTYSAKSVIKTEASDRLKDMESELGEVEIPKIASAIPKA